MGNNGKQNVIMIFKVKDRGLYSNALQAKYPAKSWTKRV